MSASAYILRKIFRDGFSISYTHPFTLPKHNQVKMQSIDGIVKTCSKCREEKEVSAFCKHSSKKDGLNPTCKVCSYENTKKWQQNNPDKATAKSKKWQQDNPEKVAASKKKYREANQEKEVAYSKKYREANPEKRAAGVKKWKQNNPEKCSAASAKRRAQELLAYPSYADDAMSALFYEERDRLNALGGERYEVDHHCPLLGVRHCGFHHADNLRLLPASVNRSLGNRQPAFGYCFLTNTTYEVYQGRLNKAKGCYV